MIGIIDISIQAANPQVPLQPMMAFINSPSSIRLREVPRKIGNWDITKVYFQASYPDDTIKSVYCTRVGNIWIGTIESSTVSGKSKNGFTVLADGVDENGADVVGYVLGKGDIYIYKMDNSIEPDTVAYYVHYNETIPTNPKKGDCIIVDGLLKMYDGHQWASSGATKTSQLENDVPFLSSHQSLSGYVKQPEADLYGDTLTNIGKNGTADVGIGAYKDSDDTWHQFVRLGWDAAYNVTIANCQDGKNRLRIGEGGNSRYINEVPIKSDIPTKTSQLSNDSGYPTETDPKHFITWFAPETSSPNKWYINFGNSSSGGISLVSDNDNPTQSYIDIAGKKITAPGFVNENGNDAQSDDEDNHLRFNSLKLAFTDDVPMNTSQLNNDSNFLTAHQSLAAYALKSQIPTKTSQLSNDSNFLTAHQSLTAYALKSQIPTKTSQLSNDSNFLTAHQSLSAYALKTSVPTKTSQLTNDSGFATTSQMPTKVSQLTNDSGFLVKTGTIDNAECIKSGTYYATVANAGGGEGKLVLIDDNGMKNMATENYVDGLVGNIETILAEING